jgi:hypothetical protein
MKGLREAAQSSPCHSALQREIFEIDFVDI